MIDGLEDLQRFEKDLTNASSKARSRAYVITRVHGRRMRDEARGFATGIAHAPHYPRSITEDGGFSLGAMTAYSEVGPDKDLPQGALGNILEFGSPTSAPQTHLVPAYDRAASAYGAALERLAGDV